MKYIYTPPPLPTVARWCALRRKFPGTSVLRSLEYERLENEEFRGRVLDIGGGRKITYPFISSSCDVDSANIDPDVEPTYLVEPNQPFPIASDAYETTICLNTLEHVYDAKFMLREIHRILKPQRTAFITVPFIFQIHGHPDDFFRGTPSWWRETLRETGFARTDLQPLVWGRCTTARMLGSRGFFPAIWKNPIAYLKDILFATIAFRVRGIARYEGNLGDRICAVSPGWFIRAIK